MFPIVIVIFFGVSFAEVSFEYAEIPLQNEVYVKIPNNLETSLHKVVHLGLLNKVNELISNGYDVDAKNVNRETPLHIAAVYHGFFFF